MTMQKRTISITPEQDHWYHTHMIKLSEFVKDALDKAMEKERKWKEKLKAQYPPLVDQV